jgi:stage V sporulation protein D (sporulation-specific penicillin-binding protein)
MDPKTGDILAMAATPAFDPNDPGVPIDEAMKEAFKTMTEEEQYAYNNSVWRNPMVTDLYEPGSVFKLVTVASGLEEGVITPDTHVICRGILTVEDRQIKCWNYPESHGEQTVKVAVGNSCNSGMIQVIQKMGYDKFAQYLELFGMTSKTEIDFPGEADSLIQSREVSGPVGLATMSFGQGMSITPIEMINAIASIGNGGKLMQPRLVKGVSDESGKMIEEFDPVVLRQVISKQTASETMDIMEYVVEEAGGTIAKIPGYRIGGKTGTGQKITDGSYDIDADKIVGSMVAMAPMDDPQFVVLMVVDEPKNGEYGSTTAGPGVRDILEEVLRYLNIKPNYTEEERQQVEADKRTVPNVTGKTIGDAQTLLLAENLVGRVDRKSNASSGAQDSEVAENAEVDAPAGTVVLRQYPEEGVVVQKDSRVILYMN